MIDQTCPWMFPFVVKLCLASLGVSRRCLVRLPVSLGIYWQRQLNSIGHVMITKMSNSLQECYVCYVNNFGMLECIISLGFAIALSTQP